MSDPRDTQQSRPPATYCIYHGKLLPCCDGKPRIPGPPPSPRYCQTCGLIFDTCAKVMPDRRCKCEWRKSPSAAPRPPAPSRPRYEVREPGERSLYYWIADVSGPSSLAILPQIAGFHAELCPDAEHHAREFCAKLNEQAAPSASPRQSVRDAAWAITSRAGLSHDRIEFIMLELEKFAKVLEAEFAGRGDAAVTGAESSGRSDAINSSSARNGTASNSESASRVEAPAPLPQKSAKEIQQELSDAGQGSSAGNPHKGRR